MTLLRKDTGLTWLAAVVAGLVTSAAVAAPLLVYTITLASFGAAHVASELRYIDRRFAGRISPDRIGLMALLLTGALAARVVGVFQVVDGTVALIAELSCVAALALSVAGGTALRCALATGVGVVLGVAAFVVPFDTLITLSILHNLTPLALFWEILPTRLRARGMAFASVGFVGLPLVAASGLPRLSLAIMGIAAPEIDPLNAGPIAQHLYVYVPTPLLGNGSAIDLFTGAVIAQCAHYAAVIVVLPILLARYDPKAHGLVAWPRTWIFVALIFCVTSLLLYQFGQSFSPTRSLYGIIASVHAWIEVPLIVIALTSNRQR